MSTLRILGIDPGLRVTGFGIVDMDGQQLRYVASGRVRGGERQPLPERLKLLLDGLDEVIRTHQPQVAVVEQVFVNVNPQST
jgi:crossover junction endodeoxyribonuclease RuvC